MNNFKKRAPLILLISTIGLGIYLVLYMHQKTRTDEILQEQITYLEMSYKQALDRFNVIGENIYYSLQNDSSIDVLINRADNALYVAKENGRNQVQLG